MRDVAIPSRCFTRAGCSARRSCGGWAARHSLALHEAEITFIEGDAEKTGLADDSFDFAISEYGAAIWCRPEAWLREAWRLLRPGGDLVFLGNHPLSLVCSPEDGAPCNAILHRPYRGMWGG